MSKSHISPARGLGVMAATILAATLAMTAPPASAHDDPRAHTIFHHSATWQECWLNIGISCDMAQLRNTHATVAVRDGECDNNGVRAEYYRSGISGMRTLHAAGCHGGERTATNRANPVTRFRVCEATKGCTSWHYT